MTGCYMVGSSKKEHEEDLRASPKKTEQKTVKAEKARQTAKGKWQSYSGTWHPELKDRFKE